VSDGASLLGANLLLAGGGPAEFGDLKDQGAELGVRWVVGERVDPALESAE
jgi:hypothetical protein